MLLLHEPKKAAAAEEKDEGKSRSPKRNGKVAWHQESPGRLHCIMQLKPLLRLESQTILKGVQYTEWRCAQKMNDLAASKAAA